jgi:hypothetical protein
MTSQPGKEAVTAGPPPSLPPGSAPEIKPAGPAPVPARPTRWQAVAAVVTGCLFFSWLSYLIFLWWTLPHAPGGGPVVLSRPQFLVSPLDVIAQIDSPTGPVTIKEIFYPKSEQNPLIGQEIRVTNLAECRPLGTWYTITDKTLALLRADKVSEDALAKLQPLKDKKLEQYPFSTKLTEILNSLARDQNLSPKEQDHLQSLVLLFAMDAKVELTERVFDLLRKPPEQGGVPENVLAKVKSLQDKLFDDQESFVAALGSKLEKDEKDRYQNLLLKPALVSMPRDYSEPGLYILALRPIPPAKKVFEVVRTPASPGFPASPGVRLGPPRIYYAIPANVAQLRQITALKPVGGDKVTR